MNPFGYPAAARSCLAFAGLYAGVKIFLRHNPPPPGVFFQGVLLGLLYAMVAFGLILIYRANRIINFAQTEMGAAGAVLAVLLIKIHHVPYLLAKSMCAAVVFVAWSYPAQKRLVFRTPHAVPA